MYKTSRRKFLLNSALSLASVTALIDGAVTSVLAKSNLTDSQQEISWDQLIETINSMLRAKQNSPGQWNQQDYVNRLSGIIAGLDLQDAFFVERSKHAFADAKAKPDFTLLHYQKSFEIQLLGFESGESILAHNHPGMANVSMCVSGQARVKSYEPYEPGSENEQKKLRSAPDGGGKGSCYLKLVGDHLVGPRQVSTLTANTRNIHSIEATRKTQLLDVFTPRYDDEIRKLVAYFDIEPNQRANGIYLARTRS